MQIILGPVTETLGSGFTLAKSESVVRQLPEPIEYVNVNVPALVGLKSPLVVVAYPPHVPMLGEPFRVIESKMHISKLEPAMATIGSLTVMSNESDDTHPFRSV